MQKIKQSNGFTIIELLIATVVFSLLLLVCTTAIMFISHSYVKGNVEIQTQDTARSIIEDISHDIEFNNYDTVSKQVAAPSTNTADNYAFCIGNHVYFYTLDEELSDGSTNNGEKNMYSPHNLYSGSYSGACPATSSKQMNDTSNGGNFSSNYQEILSQHMRLGQLSIQQLTDPVSKANINSFRITVTVGYGDDDVLSDNSPASFGGSRLPPKSSNWGPPPAAMSVWGPSFKYTCVGNNFGGQFCATSTLTAVVSSRININ